MPNNGGTRNDALHTFAVVVGFFANHDGAELKTDTTDNNCIKLTCDGDELILSLKQGEEMARGFRIAAAQHPEVAPIADEFERLVGELEGDGHE